MLVEMSRKIPSRVQADQSTDVPKAAIQTPTAWGYCFWRKFCHIAMFSYPPVTNVKANQVIDLFTEFRGS